MSTIGDPCRARRSGCGSSDRDVVVEAESHGLPGLRVVPWRPDKDERVAPLLDADDCRAGRQARDALRYPET